MHTLHSWTQEGEDGSDEEWYCVAYDHGPFCRNCINLDGTTSLGVEEISTLLWEITERDELIEKLRAVQPGTCDVRIDHLGNYPHQETKRCRAWEPC